MNRGLEGLTRRFRSSGARTRRFCGRRAMKVSRRTLLSGAVAAAAIGTRIRAQAPVDPAKVRGRPPRPVGERAASVTIRRHGRAGNQQGHPTRTLSASSRRRTCTSNDTMAASRDRSGTLLAADPRHGRAADGVHAGGSQAVSVRSRAFIFRVLRQPRAHGRVRRPSRGSSPDGEPVSGPVSR